MVQNVVQDLWIGRTATGKKTVNWMVGNANLLGNGASEFLKLDSGCFISVKEEAGTVHFAIRHQVALVRQDSLAGTVSSFHRKRLVTSQHHVAHQA